MSQALPTVRVLNPADPDGGYMIINVSDLTRDHQLWRPSVPPLAPGPTGSATALAAPPPASTPPLVSSAPEAPVPVLTVAKGPGGRWYVKRGTERVSVGFASQAEAEDAAKRSAL